MFIHESTAESKLYIRDVYESTFIELEDKISSGTITQVTITGTPGIGKSHFGIYCLINRIVQGFDVIVAKRFDGVPVYFWYNLASGTVYYSYQFPVEATSNIFIF